MHGRDARIAREIAGVQRQQVRDAMNPHGRRDTRIVQLHAGHRVSYHELPPLVVDRFLVRQQNHSLLHYPDFAIRVRRRQPEAVAVRRPRGEVSKFGDVLVRVIENGSLAGQPGKRRIDDERIDDEMVRIVAPGNSQQDVAVY